MAQRQLWTMPIYFAQGMFFDDDDSDTDINETHDMQFAEEVVPRMPDHQFKLHFRMHPETFEDLLSKVHRVYVANRNGHPEISFDKSVMITLWYLANIESFRGVASRFGVSKATAWQALYRISRSLLAVNEMYHVISWPSRNRAANIMEHFRDKHGLPGVIGLIDGSHIKIVAPKANQQSYINRKGYHSVLLQGICDHRKLFTDVYTGEAGSIHDYTLFLRADVSRKADDEFPDDSHLIGDLAYKLTTKMLVGFKNNGRLTNRQKAFNKVLSKARVKIENAFALLKGRFRRLKYMETVRPDLLCLLIVAACILHNLCILDGDAADDILNIDEELAQERLWRPNNHLDIDYNEEDANNRAQLKRENIINGLRVRNNNP